VAVIEVDAPHQPELTERYRVLTVPTTVVLDAVGQARAVNYGFANTQQLRKQVNEVLQRSSYGLSQKLCDKLRVCEHTLKIYGNGSCMQSIRGSHEQKLSRRLKSHGPRLSAT